MEIHWQVDLLVLQPDLRKHTVEASMDGAYGNGGLGGWHMGASIVDGCDGRGGAGGWFVGETTEDAWNMKYGGGGR
jgi:hypothetical protein